MKKLLIILLLFFINQVYSEEREIYDTILDANSKELKNDIEEVNKYEDDFAIYGYDFEPKILRTELYIKGKLLYNEKNYYEAKEIFEKLIDPIRKNDNYTPYFLFYYALINYKIGEVDDAKYFFEYLKNNYKNWEQIDEVIFWLTKINFKTKDYLSAINLINEIKEIKNRKVYYKKGKLIFRRNIRENKRVF